MTPALVELVRRGKEQLRHADARQWGAGMCHKIVCCLGCVRVNHTQWPLCVHHIHYNFSLDTLDGVRLCFSTMGEKKAVLLL